MKSAVEEAVLENKSLIEDDISLVGLSERDLKAGFDGTWQRRGFSSLNGVVTCTSIDTGKVLDVQVLSKYCTCLDKNNHDPNCTANYLGFSGGMEGTGLLEIFNRSIEKYNVRYVQYLGDGDTNSFKNVVDNIPYDVEITKLACIGHIQKRMGGRLRRLKKTMKKVKLSDNLPIGGKNRLTDAVIDQLQTYYGNAIRKTTNSLEKMREAVWAIYWHKYSTNENPFHGLCPKGEDTWCGYNKSKERGETYDHTHSLPEAVMKVIKPTFEALAKTDLLRKCLHGKTQNVNESVNNVIWSRVPKKNFVRLNTLEFGVCDAISTFNDGHITKCHILSALGLQPSVRTVEAMKRIDMERIRMAEKATSEFYRRAGREARLAKKRLEEDLEEIPAYNPGLH